MAPLGMDVVEHSPPLLVQAIGSRVWSDDGSEYVDFDNLGGAVLLGHRDPQVVAAVRLARGGADERAFERCEREVGERIRDMAPAAEACAFGGEVSQALRAAATAAQIFTGREAVFACNAVAGRETRRVKGDRFAFDDLDALERLMAVHGEAPAAIVLAPCAGQAPSAGYLAGVRAFCDRIGAVLVFDETLSGFRVHEGGAQALYGVEPDLMVFGESLANGMPLSVLAGRRDLVWAVQQHEPLRADMACLAAARAVLKKIEVEPVIATLRIGGAEIQAEVAARLQAAGLDAVAGLTGDPAAGRLEFSRLPGIDPQAVRSLWMNECRAHRLFTLGAVNMSYAHGEREIAVLLAAFDQAADRLARALRQAVPQPRPRSPGRTSAAQSLRVKAPRP
ncbi:MAG: aminotransferase class III-fold pyridoxal phosphate-dependent enzyme [Caulobacteraceae bacterium]